MTLLHHTLFHALPTQSEHTFFCAEVSLQGQVHAHIIDYACAVFIKWTLLKCACLRLVSFPEPLWVWE